MAKKAAKQKVLADRDGEIGDQVPEEVQDAVDEYMAALRAKNKAQGKVNGAKEDAVTAMRAHGITRVMIDNGEQWLKLEDDPKLKTEKRKDPNDDTPKRGRGRPRKEAEPAGGRDVFEAAAGK